MLTLTAPPETKPSAAAIAAYRKHVHAQPAEPDPDILHNSWRIESDFRADSLVYEKRLAASYALSSTVPDLQLQLAEARSAMQNERRTGERALSEFGTVGQLWDALMAHQVEIAPNRVTPAYGRVREIESAIGAERTNAMNTLRATSDPAIGRKLADLAREAADTRTSITDLERLANIDERIERQTDLLRRMAADTGEKAKKAYREQRVKLTELQALQPQKAEALAALQERRQKLNDILRQTAALEAERLIPANQEWSQ